MKPTLVELQSPRGYGKVWFATSGPPNLTNTGDNRKNNCKNIILIKTLIVKSELVTRLVHHQKPAATPHPDLPEAGKLDRPELKKGDKVLAVTGDMLNEWLEGTVQEVVVGGPEVPELQKSYKVRIPR